MDGVIVTKNLSVKRVSFIKGRSIGDQERVCQILQLLQLERVLVIKNVSDNLFSFFNGESIGDQELTCQTLQYLQRRDYLWPERCLSNSSVSSMEGKLVIKNVSVKLSSFIKGLNIGDQELVCQILQLLQWTEYWWPRTCLSNASASLREGVLVIKNVSVKFYSFFNCREYWWSRKCLPISSVSSMEGILVIKNVSVKFFSFSNGSSIGYQERVRQILQLLQWR